MKRFDSASTAKLDIEFHQPLADTQSSVIGMYANLKKLGFPRHIPKTYKTDYPLFTSAFNRHDKTISKRVLHLSNEHVLGPRGVWVGTF